LRCEQQDRIPTGGICRFVCRRLETALDYGRLRHRRVIGSKPAGL